MRFFWLIQIFKERMAGADLELALLGTLIVLLVLSLALWRWGTGVLIGVVFCLVALQLTKSNVINGLVLIGRFPLVVLLSIYALLARKNRRPLFALTVVLGLFPVVMIINSVQAVVPVDAFGLGILFLLFYVGLILGGRKILGDVRGRAVFTKFVAMFTIVMTCIQLPYFSATYGRFEGTFESVIGFMVVGMAGVIVLVWFGMQKRAWSMPFIFYMLFAALTFSLLMLTGGRSALGGTVLGVLVILSRKLKRNVIIFLAVMVITVPIMRRAILAFPGFEAVKAKLTSRSLSLRGELASLAWQEVKSKPLFGWGTGSSTVKGMIQTGHDYHNSYLQFALEHGIPFGLVIFFLYLWLPFRGLLLTRRCHTEELKNAANLSTAFLAAYVASGFLAHGLLMTTGVLPFYSAIALQEGVYAENRELDLYGYDWVEYAEGERWADEADEVLSGQFLG